MLRVIHLAKDSVYLLGTKGAAERAGSLFDVGKRAGTPWAEYSEEVIHDDSAVEKCH